MPSREGKMPLAITKENKSIKKELVENDPDVVSVVAYLNDKTSKQFKASSKATARLVIARLREGYIVEDLKKLLIRKRKNGWIIHVGRRIYSLQRYSMRRISKNIWMNPESSTCQQAEIRGRAFHDFD